MKLSRALLAAAVGLCLMVPVTPAFAYIPEDQDQTPATEAEIAEALANGDIDTDVSQFDNGIATYAATDYAVRTLGGSDRYETSAKQALYAFPRTSTAIVASGAGYADSICAAGLAGALDCPIILTEPGSVGSVTSNALKSMGVTDIILLGSETVASKQVENQLRSIVGSSGSVERVWGEDRYATQMAVYEYGVEHGLWTGGTVVAASAEGFADALSVSPVSFKLKAPVIYIDGSLTFPEEQEQIIRSDLKNKNFILTGSTVVTSAAAEKFLDSVGSGSVVRLGGSDRYLTSEAISKYAVSSLGMSWNNVAFTSGTAPYDALGGGPVQGGENSVLLLKEETDPKSSIDFPFNSVSRMKFFGDAAIYSGAFKTRCALALGFDLTDIEGFRLYLDAGHGSGSNGTSAYDPGATAADGTAEAALTSDLADRVASVLRNQYGLQVYVNKDGWYKTRQAEAYALDCGALVSIHFNAFNGSASGTESYIHSYNNAYTSDILQSRIHDDLVNAMGLSDRGKKRQELAVLGGNLPATLLEICYIDNRSDLNAYYAKRDAVASAIARGIAEG